MDQDQLQAWKHSPITKEVLARLEQKILSVNTPHFIPTSIDETALRNAHLKGHGEGLRETFDIIQDMEDAK